MDGAVPFTSHRRMGGLELEGGIVISSSMVYTSFRTGSFARYADAAVVLQAQDRQGRQP